MHASPTGRSAAFVFSVVLAACSGGATDPQPAKPGITPTSITLQSDAGDYIGQGQAYSYGRGDALIRVGVFGNRLSVQISGDEDWSGNFQLPSAVGRISPGTYTGLTRYPFNRAATGGLDWSGEGRGCSTLTGSLTVDSATFAGDTLTGVDLRFEQHCEGAAAALRGTVHWRAADTTRVAGPSAPPASLWRPPTGAVPASGDYTYLQSDAGDYVGGGVTTLYTPSRAPTRVSAAGARATVSVGGWDGTFQGMNSLTRLQEGYYPNLQRWPFNNPNRGGLSWGGNGRGCNTLRGWFVVDHVSYSGDQLTGIALRFEQHCEGNTPALRGAVRWGS